MGLKQPPSNPKEGNLSRSLQTFFFITIAHRQDGEPGRLVWMGGGGGKLHSFHVRTGWLTNVSHNLLFFLGGHFLPNIRHNFGLCGSLAYKGCFVCVCVVVFFISLSSVAKFTGIQHFSYQVSRRKFDDGRGKVLVK